MSKEQSIIPAVEFSTISYERSAEQKLLMAVIIRAIKDIFDRNPAERQDALAFLLSNSMRKWSFRWACEQLDLNPTVIRRLLSANRHDLRKTGLFDIVHGR